MLVAIRVLGRAKGHWVEVRSTSLAGHGQRGKAAGKCFQLAGCRREKGGLAGDRRLEAEVRRILRHEFEDELLGILARGPEHVSQLGNERPGAFVEGQGNHQHWIKRWGRRGIDDGSAAGGAGVDWATGHLGGGERRQLVHQVNRGRRQSGQRDRLGTVLQVQDLIAVESDDEERGTFGIEGQLLEIRQDHGFTEGANRETGICALEDRHGSGAGQNHTTNIDDVQALGHAEVGSDDGPHIAGDKIVDPIGSDKIHRGERRDFQIRDERGQPIQINRQDLDPMAVEDQLGISEVGAKRGVKLPRTGQRPHRQVKISQKSERIRREQRARLEGLQDQISAGATGRIHGQA